MSVEINKDKSIICQENNETIQESFKLTFYPDGANLLDKERMQKFWNHIETESRCQEILFAEQPNEVKLKCSKNDENMGKERSSDSNEEKRGIENEMDKREETAETTPIKTAIELLDYFRELHMIEDCLKRTAGQVIQSPCLYCSSAEDSQANLDDILSQMKHHQEKIVTQVIGSRRARNVDQKFS